VIESLCEGFDFRFDITRDTFEELCADLFECSLTLVHSVLKDAKVLADKVEEVVLVGGSTRIPKVREMLQGFFNKTLIENVMSEGDLARGAAMQAATLSGVESASLKENIVLHECMPTCVGIQMLGGIMHTVAQRCAPMPLNGFQIVTPYANDQSSVCINIFEGNEIKTKGNTLLARVKLDNIMPVSPGPPRIEVSYDISQSGKMTWTVRNMETHEGVTAYICCVRTHTHMRVLVCVSWYVCKSQHVCMHGLTTRQPAHAK
jgi:L1 cell adhesion molecule like protein